MAEYNSNWSSEIRAIDVKKSDGTSITSQEATSYKEKAVGYLNQQSIRGLPPDKFNALVKKIEKYLLKVDTHVDLLNVRFDVIKNEIITGTKDKLGVFRDEKNVEAITKMLD
jgi:hypothetical protein